MEGDYWRIGFFVRNPLVKIKGLIEMDSPSSFAKASAGQVGEFFFIFCIVGFFL